MPIQQPSNVIKLTNVSVVRLKKGGRRFEIACYKNKVQEWRKGVEKNLDDVLQSENVFVNVSKGELAKEGDLKAAFKGMDHRQIALEILKNGELQVGEKEREHELNNLRKEIANRVTESVVDPATQRPYSLGIIEKAMHEVGFNVKPNKNVKSQVLECIHMLQEKSKLPIQRARMRIRIYIPTEEIEKFESRILEGAAEVERKETVGDVWQASLLIDPSQFRVYRELLDKECKSGRMEVADHAVTAGGTVS